MLDRLVVLVENIVTEQRPVDVLANDRLKLIRKEAQILRLIQSMEFRESTRINKNKTYSNRSAISYIRNDFVGCCYRQCQPSRTAAECIPQDPNLVRMPQFPSMVRFLSLSALWPRLSRYEPTSLIDGNAVGHCTRGARGKLLHLPCQTGRKDGPYASIIGERQTNRLLAADGRRRIYSWRSTRLDLVALASRRGWARSHICQTMMPNRCDGACRSDVCVALLLSG